MSLPPRAPERMSRVDNAWLRMDTPANLMMIVGIWLIEPGMNVDELRTRVSERLLRYDRFRQKVVEDTLGGQWVEDPTFEIENHVQAASLRQLKGQAPLAALKDRVAELAAVPLNPSRPLWHFELIEHLDDGEGGQGRSAFIVRVHHCIGDGIALISVMLSIADGGKAPPQRRRKPVDPDAEHNWLGETLIKPLADLTIKAIGLTGGGVAKSMDLMAHPEDPLLQSLEAAKMGYQVMQDAASLALMPDDSPTRLKGKATPGKQVAWGEPLALDEVKIVGQALGASINDVLLTCVAGALGDYLRAKGDDPTGKEIRAMVPVNLRPLDQAWKLGNRFGLVPLVLPIGIANPVERLAAVKARMNDLKGGYQPVLAFALLAVAGLLIKPMQDLLLGLFAKKATAVMTNVPGPRDPLQFCGRTVKQVMFWVPQSGDIGLGVSILSYAGGVQFGLITDDTLCPDPELIIAGFQPQFEQLLHIALMLPWDEQD